jgi:hypothetical protein
MKTRTLVLVLFLSLSCVLAWAQTNAPAAKPVEQDLDISSDSFYFDGITNQMVYLGHVFVTYDVKDKLTCERLTVDLPADRGNPTNIVAETNVVVELLESNGKTDHVTANKAVYFYQRLNPVTNMVNNLTNVIYAVTNETVTFTGGDPMPKLWSSNGSSSGYMLADPLIFHVIERKFETPGHVEMHYRQISSPGKTNNSPFGL